MPHSNTTKNTASAEIAALISRLLSHYWTGDDPPAARKGQIADWIEDLAEFPLDVVEEACRRWRRRPEPRRPTPGEIRATCKEIVAWRRHQQEYLPTKDPEAWSLQQIKCRADAYAKYAGFKDLEDFLTHHRDAVMETPQGRILLSNWIYEWQESGEP